MRWMRLCASSTVATVEMVDLSLVDDAASRAVADDSGDTNHIQRDLCQWSLWCSALAESGRCGLGRSGVCVGAIPSCRQARQQMAASGVTTPASVQGAVGKRSNPAALIADPFVGPLAD